MQYMAPALTLEEVDALPVTHLGPVWTKSDDGNWLLPDFTPGLKTLGWQIAGWCAKYVGAPDVERSPWKFTDEQMRFLLWWYAVDEEGRFIYRKGVLQRLKGWGKDPLAAVICLIEFVGPSRFSHWDDAGEPVAVPHPRAWVQVTAVSQPQTTNTMALMPSLITKKMADTYGIKQGAELIRANGGKLRLEAVTSSYRALEGKRTTFTLLNETQHWIQGNNGPQMYETIDGNATKQDARYLSITNAYLPGEDSVAERQREAYEKMIEGRAVDVGILYDSIEAHPSTPMTPEALNIVIPKIRGDAHWLKVDAILDSILDVTIPISRSRRMWLNQIVADEDAIHTTQAVAEITLDDALLAKGDDIVLGFDGSVKRDATGLVAIRIPKEEYPPYLTHEGQVRDRQGIIRKRMIPVRDEQGNPVPHPRPDWRYEPVAHVLGLWENPGGEAGEEWEVDRDQVASVVETAFQDYSVRGFYADVAYWEPEITTWTEEHKERLDVRATQTAPIAWDMRTSKKRAVLAHEALKASIDHKQIFISSDLGLKRHILNARRRMTAFGLLFGKESRDSPRKVDLYAALMLAHQCYNDWRTRGKKQNRTGRGYFT